MLLYYYKVSIHNTTVLICMHRKAIHAVYYAKVNILAINI
jgi:hypothetical protein